MFHSCTVRYLCIGDRTVFHHTYFRTNHLRRCIGHFHSDLESRSLSHISLESNQIRSTVRRKCISGVPDQIARVLNSPANIAGHPCPGHCSRSLSNLYGRCINQIRRRRGLSSRDPGSPL
ncbi:hypothetical protein X975_26914, partial [Stegodyphus mimosarum]